jgi:general secretion pathway protein D
MYSAEEGSIPFDDRHPIVFPNDGKDWSAFAKNRSKFAKDGKRARSEQDIEIEKKLRTPVSLQFTNAPLSKVMDYLAKLAEVNLYLDPQGLAEEGVTTDTPVTIDLRHEIMLKSALHLILEPLHLSYVIKDEVLKVTSEQMRDGQVYTVTYNVAHLVIPIPNFVPGSMGLQNAYHDALGSVGTVGFGGSMPFSSGSTATPMPVVATRDGRGSGGSLNSSLMAQVANGGTHPGITSGVKNPVAGAGPGGLGGGAQADFDSLIDLITSTVKPTSWDDVGGPGSIRPFETNLSIVVSQTQEVHEEIVDLLEQLRRLQDLQVTIEVRFITLNDKFFERIGVSFDFDVNDNIDGSGVAFGAVQPGQGINYQSAANFATGQGVNRNVTNQDSNQTITVGMSSPGVFNADLDIPFTQGSYNLAKPAFGGFDPTANAGASLGFAILSDIEAYFFVTAAQGDQRSNVLQAPKVTLFNGQQAFVSDTSQSPFVISVIPVVGDFAAAQQPVIVVLSEGTFMTVQAVVSADRRFVRLTVVPFFSKIGDVKTFTFTGSTSSTSDSTREGLNSGATDPSKLWNKTGNNNSVQTTGTTVQLPTFSYVTVTTTVSVPDGGTVLLGGIKRLSEGRNEFGVPLLNKLPYINRLFKNTSIGRETQSLMMMVTPRIIIQEEEEEKLGIQSPP